MTDFRVDVEVGSDHVATVEFERGPNNYFNLALISTIADALEYLAGDGAARAIVLCSAGRHFCPGADFTGGAEPQSADIETGDAHLYDAAVRLFRQPLPVIAAVQGAAVGGGLGLAMAADLRVAGEDVRFGAPFARLGLHQGFGLSVTLPLVIGHQAALDLLYTGRRVKGEEALALGLCDRLVPNDELRAATHAWAAEIAASAPIAVRSIRRTMRGHLADQVEAATDHEKAEQAIHRRTADFAEGVRADLQRRPPNFTGT
jgi:2-(1,2-epoxy-1,2-dihydrophenyl)acetyl-CoA isomerase